jgi:prepilin-type N-terminal cleavage/methylation domain-containing protein
MKGHSSSRAFTIIELLVVVSIIALLVGILLPAIGKAREQANLTKSQANIKQIGTALATYAAEYHDRQLTFVDDNLAHYGGTAHRRHKLRATAPAISTRRSTSASAKASSGATTCRQPPAARPETG